MAAAPELTIRPAEMRPLGGRSRSTSRLAACVTKALRGTPWTHTCFLRALACLSPHYSGDKVHARLTAHPRSPDEEERVKTKRAAVGQVREQGRRPSLTRAGGCCEHGHRPGASTSQHCSEEVPPHPLVTG